jgi:hypothetical protein
VLDRLHPILGSAVDTWATVFVAIGTVGAVAYALFRDLFVVPRRRPKLDLRFEHAGNDQVVVETAGGFDAAYVRLRVANGAGKDTADDVVVIVTEVRRLEDSERALAQTKPIGLPLTWSGSNPPLTVASVHPGSERHIDLLHVDWPAGDEIDIARKWSETASVQLDLTPKPAGGQETLDCGTYEKLEFTRLCGATHRRGMSTARRRCGITSALSRRGGFAERSFGTSK